MRRAGRRALLALATILAASPLAPAMEPNLYIAPEFWHVNLSGGGDTGNGSSDRQFDVADTLGLDTSATSRSLESFLRFTKSSVIFGFSHAAFHGGDTLGSNLTFRGRLFLAGSRISSDLNYDHTKLLYGTSFVDGKALTAGLRVGLYEYKISSLVRQSGAGSPDAEIRSTIPIIGASMALLPTPQLRIHGEVLTTSFDRGGIHSRVQEGYAAVDYILFAQTVGITAGYRYNTVKADDKGTARFNLRERGNFVGIVVRF
jgi:hypothetical protein